jgi:hypothetical protein
MFLEGGLASAMISERVTRGSEHPEVGTIGTELMLSPGKRATESQSGSQTIRQLR